MRLQFAFAEPFSELADAFGESLRFAAREIAPEHAHDGAALEQRQIQRNLGNVARGESNHQQPSAPGGGAQRGFGVGAAHRVVHHVHALAAGELLDLLAHVLGGVVDAGVGAVLFADLQLVGAGGAGDHLRAHRLADLDRSQADAACRAQHQQRFAGFELAAVAQRVVRRSIGEQKCRRAVEIHALGNRHQASRVDFDFLRERAVGGERDHAVARLETFHSFADFLHQARHFAARGKGQRRFELVLVLDDEHVREIQARRLDADDDFAGARLGRRQVFNDEGFRRTELLSTTKPNTQANTSSVTKDQPIPITKPPSTINNPNAQTSSGAGGYYLDDGPGDNPPANIDSIPDAPLKNELPLTRANKPYMALGQKYVPMTTYVPYKKQGIASWYGKRYHGKKTSTGEIYDMYAMSGAHPILPIPSYVKVTNPANGRAVIVRINDRGPFKHDRLIDLSYAAAYKLRLTSQGSGLVEVEAIDTSPAAIQKIKSTLATTPAADVAGINQLPTPTQPTSISVGPVNNGTQYYVQAGAFKNEGNGDLLQKKIQSLALAENVKLAKVYNNGLYRVRLGPYTSKNEADTAAANIRKQLNISTIVQSQ